MDLRADTWVDGAASYEIVSICGWETWLWADRFDSYKEQDWLCLANCWLESVYELLCNDPDGRGGNLLFEWDILSEPFSENSNIDDALFDPPESYFFSRPGSSFF